MSYDYRLAMASYLFSFNTNDRLSSFTFLPWWWWHRWVMGGGAVASAEGIGGGSACSSWVGVKDGMKELKIKIELIW